MSRPYDIVIWGATGYTGKLCCEYVAKNIAFQKVKIALAARNEKKLASSVTLMSKINSDYSNIPKLIGDSANSESLAKIAASATILINCVGPFRTHGEPVVRACLKSNTHYIDICGETSFIRTMITKYSEEARAKGLLFVLSAGWDCVPADIGSLFTELQFPPGRAIAVHGHFTPPGFLFSVISNGTYRSLIQSLRHQKADALEKKQLANNATAPSFLKSARVPGIPGRKPHKFDKGWSVPFPTADPWVTRHSREKMAQQFASLSPQDQAAVESSFSKPNPTVISTADRGRTPSAALSSLSNSGKHMDSIPVHKNFSYSHFLRVGSIFYMLFMAITFSIVTFLSKFDLGVSILYKFKSDGQGLDSKSRKVSSSKHAMVGWGYSIDQQILNKSGKLNKPNLKVETVMNTPDMYTATAIFVVEGALTILDLAKSGNLKTRAGCHTPGSGLGRPYLKRLEQHSSINFQIISSKNSTKKSK